MESAELPTAGGSAAELGGAGLLNVKEVASLLGCGQRSVYRLSDSGRMPQPVRVGRRLVRWRRDELEAWIEGGCPAVRVVKGGGR